MMLYTNRGPSLRVWQTFSVNTPLHKEQYLGIQYEHLLSAARSRAGACFLTSDSETEQWVVDWAPKRQPRRRENSMALANESAGKCKRRETTRSLVQTEGEKPADDDNS